VYTRSLREPNRDIPLFGALQLFGKSIAPQHPKSTLADIKVNFLHEGPAMPHDFVVPISKHRLSRSPLAGIASARECAPADRSPNEAGAC
jgi:hypothetical protein